MNDEDAFLRSLLQDPADDTTRLVYADWLDERGDTESTTKAQFLRLTVRLLESGRPAAWRKARRKEMQPLAAALPTEWLAVVSRLKVENCDCSQAQSRAERRYQDLFAFVCDRRWDEMSVTDAPAVRFCEGCKQSVHYCDTITQAREHAQQGHCVAVDLGIIRRHDDLAPRRTWVGRPSAEMLRQEEERCQVDEVTRMREEAKGMKRGQHG